MPHKKNCTQDFLKPMSFVQAMLQQNPIFVVALCRDTRQFAKQYTLFLLGRMGTHDFYPTRCSNSSFKCCVKTSVMAFVLFVFCAVIMQHNKEQS
jgi:hypothetical protein